MKVFSTEFRGCYLDTPNVFEFVKVIQNDQSRTEVQ